ncbi:MAG: TonB-dependent receptor [Gammaproteobacteria bacterium]|nr:TonB-dependent receptor [Gammaproteobacteria bacterium]MBT4493029.1 TonB-dependent receptor [Gammaproteobacteria bacterium]
MSIKIRVRIFRVSRVCAIGLGLLLPFAFATTQAEAAKQERVIEEVIVTAQKREQSLMDAAIDVTAFSGDQLTEAGIDDVFGIAKAVPGVTIQNTGANPQIFMRGVGTRITGTGLDSGVAVYVDDRFVTRQGGQVFDIYDVERVEVLKGPQGVLFGRNATGGAIRIISKEVSDELEGELSLGYGSDSYQMVRGFVNVPVNDDFGIRVSAQSRQRDAFKENIIPGAEDFDDLDAQSIRVKARWDVSDNSTLKFTYDRSKATDLSSSGAISLDGGNSRGISLGGITTTERDEIASSMGTDPSYGSPKIESDSFQLRFETSLSDSLELAAYATYLDYSSSKPGDYDGTSFQDVEVEYAISESNDFGFGFEVSSDSGGPLTWVVGANYFEGDAESDFDLRVGPAGGGSVKLSVGFAEYQNTSYGVFGSLDYDFSERWTLTVGGRYSYEDKENDLSTSSIGVATVSPVPASDSDSWNEFTPKVTLTYNLDNGIVYGTFASGFKSGGFNHPLREGTVIDPETLDMIELGYKADLTDSLRLTSSLFVYSYKDLQVTKAASEGATVSTENATDSDIRGIDVDLTWAATDKLTLKINAEYLDTEYEDYETAGRAPNTVLTGDPAAIGYGFVFFNAKGQEMLRSPELAVYAAVQYDSQLSIGGREGNLSLNMNYAWKDDYIFDFEVDPLVDVTQDAHGILNARATLAIEKVSLSVWGKNLTDEKYFFDKVVAASNNRGNYGHPRTYGVDFAYRF